jgi:soluble lytic murein transglycosylase-like protein
MLIYLSYALMLIGLPLVAAPRQPLAALKPEQALAAALQKQRASVLQQRHAVRQQLGEKAGVDMKWVEQFIDPLPALTPPACPALNNSRLNELVETAAQRQSLDPALLRAVMRQESAFNPCAVSVKGALGLMQLMPETARELHVADVLNPEQNIRGGAAYLKQLLDRYSGDLRLALVGYNAGPGRADQPVGVPYPVETQNYVANILAELGIGPAAQPTLNEESAPSDRMPLNNEVVPEVADEETPADAVIFPGPAVSNPSAGVETTKRLQLTKIRSWL